MKIKAIYNNVDDIPADVDYVQDIDGDGYDRLSDGEFPASLRNWTPATAEFDLADKMRPEILRAVARFLEERDSPVTGRVLRNFADEVEAELKPTPEFEFSDAVKKAFGEASRKTLLFTEDGLTTNKNVAEFVAAIVEAASTPAISEWSTAEEIPPNTEFTSRDGYRYLKTQVDSYEGWCSECGRYEPTVFLPRSAPFKRFTE
ncbi:hypothetical protein ACFU44_00625 [Nocardia rhizosphaerihabitans]|uniref:hypothetical protein n=1 Tax=Nocardia rhizosphaerihabitans TaxID=1691570 RepID=UPI00367189FC